MAGRRNGPISNRCTHPGSRYNATNNWRSQTGSRCSASNNRSILASIPFSDFQSPSIHHSQRRVLNSFPRKIPTSPPKLPLCRNKPFWGHRPRHPGRSIAPTVPHNDPQRRNGRRNGRFPPCARLALGSPTGELGIDVHVDRYVVVPSDGFQICLRQFRPQSMGLEKNLHEGVSVTMDRYSIGGLSYWCALSHGAFF